MMNKLQELEKTLGYGLELYLNEDGDRVIIQSGTDRPPEQDEIYKEFQSRSQAKRWISQTNKRLKNG